MPPKINAIISFIFPSAIAIWLLNQLGHQIDRSAHIGFSWLQCQHIKMSENSKIGHFNLIRIPNIALGQQASIRSFNRMKGPLSLLMQKQAAIGNSNSIYRAESPIALGAATLTLGELAILTSKHSLDCTRSISIGDFTTISGFNTQFWTHGFYHADRGADRIRVDGAIKIGNNVSIGSRCMINPGVEVGDAINVGGNACLSKSIYEPGMYVAQPLRFIPNSISKIKSKLQKNDNYKIVKVYEKPVA